ncbi:DUF3500 domain-containing protein [Jatrophihabitans sp.]|jgi:hypothetical protein|uniref:DUF3500 domain-containing protein n=1 Tax=Jatrophihabitans sp. TaxID=1932789 RepID=UPI002F147582
MAVHPKTASGLRAVAQRLLADGAGQVREPIGFPSDSPMLNRWTYLPGARPGLVMGDMTRSQRLLVHRLIALVLSEACHAQLATIMALEDVLDRREGHRRGRHSTDFWVLIFGNPDLEETWHWRLEGHHACVHVTVSGDDVSVDPLFLGCHPAVIAAAGRVVTAPLAREGDLARELAVALPPEQRAALITASSPPPDIYSGHDPRLPPDQLERLRGGIPVAAFDGTAARRLSTLLDLYSARLSAPLAGELRAALDADQLRFSWEGSTDPGLPHYYRLAGSSYLMEHENAADQANHVHNVMRRCPGAIDSDDVLQRHRAAEGADDQS